MHLVAVDLAQEGHDSRLLAGSGRPVEQEVREVLLVRELLQNIAEVLMVVELLELLRSVLVNPEFIHRVLGKE